MPSVDESLGPSASPINDALRAGVEAISRVQTINFTKYRRVVLPIDGYVFWVKDDLVSPGALYNGIKFSAAPGINQGPKVVTPAPYITVTGSLHYATDAHQDEAEDYAVNRVVFTSESEVNDLNAIDPGTMYIGEWEGVRFGFNSRSSFYRQANLFHYVGNAIYADMDPQVIDNVADLNSLQVVSNSLPIWLSLNSYVAPPPGLPWPLILFPSFLTPQNEVPPYGAVHIVPETTQALTGAPYLSPSLSHSQLTMETAKVTLWGLKNFNAMDFVDFINQFTLDTDMMGIMNIPTIRDEKRTQTELGTLAQKKSVEFQVNYYQGTARNIARQLISRVIPSYIIN